MEKPILKPEHLEIVDSVIEKAEQLKDNPEKKAVEEPKATPKKKAVEEPKKERRGRPKGSSDKKPTKIKLKPTPKSATEAFKEEFKGLDCIAIYGVDEFTEKLIRELWSDPNKNFVVTDLVDQRSATLTRSIGSLPYSMYRYNQMRPQGFIESGMFPVIIVAEEYWENVNKLPNPNKVIFTCLSHWGK